MSKNKTLAFIIIVITAIIPLWLFSNLKELGDKSQLNENATLKNYYEITKLDPLFYSPFVDSTFDFTKYRNYEEIIFSGFTKQFGRSLYKYYQEQGKTLNLIPHKFLELLTENISKTNKFLESPTLDNAKELIVTNENTTDAYLENLHQLGEIINLVTSIQTPDKLVNTGLGRLQGFAVAIADLKLMQKNGDELKNEIEKRKKILNGEADFNIPKFVVPENLSTDEFATDTFFSKKDAKEELWETYIWEWKDLATVIKGRPFTREQFNSVNVQGPYQIDILCFPPDSQFKHLVYGFFPPENSFTLPYPRFMIADGLTYRLPGHVPFTDQPREEWLKDNPMTLCSCPYIENAKLVWFLIDFMKIRLEDKKVFSVLSSDNHSQNLNQIISQGATLEEKFLKYPTQNNLFLLGDHYKAFYYAIAKMGENGETVPRSIERSKETSWQYYTLVQSKIAFLQKVFDHLYGALEKRSVVDFRDRFLSSPQHGILEGSQYSLLYMPWSKSVWRLNEDPNYYDDESENPWTPWNKFVTIQETP